MVGCVFWVSVPFHLFFQNYVFIVVHIFPYYLFEACRLCSDSTYFTSSISNLFSLFRFYYKPSWSFVNFVDIFKEHAFGFIDFSLLSFCFLFHRCLHLSLFSSICFLHLFCFSFTKFLRRKIRLQIWDISCFLMKHLVLWKTLSALILPVSHRSWYVVILFLFISVDLFISLMPSSLVHVLCRNVLLIF